QLHQAVDQGAGEGEIELLTDDRLDEALVQGGIQHRAEPFTLPDHRGEQLILLRPAVKGDQIHIGGKHAAELFLKLPPLLRRHRLVNAKLQEGRLPADLHHEGSPLRAKGPVKDALPHKIPRFLQMKKPPDRPFEGKGRTRLDPKGFHEPHHRPEPFSRSSFYHSIGGCKRKAPVGESSRTKLRAYGRKWPTCRGNEQDRRFAAAPSVLQPGGCPVASPFRETASLAPTPAASTPEACPDRPHCRRDGPPPLMLGPCAREGANHSFPGTGPGPAGTPTSSAGTTQ